MLLHPVHLQAIEDRTPIGVWLLFGVLFTVVPLLLGLALALHS